MEFDRASGILLHPTSLPSRYGIGDIGTEAKKFIDFLKKSKQRLWQILPINPPGYGYSPYQCFSAFAGNELLISIDGLIAEGLLSENEIKDLPQFNKERVEFDRVKVFKERLYKIAFNNFNSAQINNEYNQFVTKYEIWLENYALFMALKEYFDGLPWNHWEKSIAFRDKEAIERYKNLLHEKIKYYKFLQYIFYSQWEELKEYGDVNGIKIIGDIPIYVSYDSSDVWANPRLFKLDELGNPRKVAGVPPDYFSATGQLWGNPIYKWKEMEKDDYGWWRERFKNLLELVHIIRVDHFRGFESYWEVPGGEKTAVKGKWVKGPGAKFFSTVSKYLGNLPVIAEDLGIITPEVTELRKKFNFPGMRVLQFEFESGMENEYFPYIHEENTVVYTGTHDNDTTVGWYKKRIKAKEFFNKYLSQETNLDEKDICWYLIKYALKSKANIAIIPLQDIFCLDSHARMNEPGTITGNWEWRFQKDVLTEEIAEKLKELTIIYNR
ncbi:MAG: 4-alpha-glucanotransferase [Clostridiales bacterium]|jgi:4-alpha-glucanotransferase|nr:4-alpha-glucanotransferase [Clostridiales bacterium]